MPGGVKQKNHDGADSAEAAVAAAPIDVFIPPFYRYTNPAAVFPSSIVTVDYGTADTFAPLNEPHGFVDVTYAPYVMRHRTERALGSNEDVFTSANAPLKPEELRANAKQGLMEVLLGGGATGENMLSDNGRPLPAPTIAEEVQHRLRGSRCEATYVTSPQLMVALIRIILTSRTDPSRSLVDCVTAIDISHTQLGKVGANGPPLHFDAEGHEVPAPADFVATRFYPDECVHREETPPEVRRSVCERSLALTYVAPLLFTPGMRFYCIRELVCSHCGLSDSDAHALALILRTVDSTRKSLGQKVATLFHRGKEQQNHTATTMSCTLETLDVSFNHITDAGMAELTRAIKHNRRILYVVCAGNSLRNKQKVMDELERRLVRNREAKTSATWRRVLHWRLASKKP